MATKKSGIFKKFLSDKLDFQLRMVKRDKEDSYIIIKGSIHPEVLTIVTIYASNIVAPKYIKQI